MAVVGIAEIAAGFVERITSEATAVPSAIPTHWCNAPGSSKIEQRRIAQPFIYSAYANAIFARFPSPAYSRGNTGAPQIKGYWP